MRRRLSTLALSVLTLLLVAAPALAATEGEEAVDMVGDFGGLALAAVLGIVVGIATFAVSQSGHTDEPHDEHH